MPNTQHLLTAIQSDPGRPQMPWRRMGKSLSMPTNALTKKAYNGINVLSLWTAIFQRGFRSSVWATHKQWQEMGAQVRKGVKSELVVFYKEYQVEAESEDDDGKRRVARASFVFNADQSTITL